VYLYRTFFNPYFCFACSSMVPAASGSIQGYYGREHYSMMLISFVRLLANSSLYVSHILAWNVSVIAYQRHVTHHLMRHGPWLNAQRSAPRTPDCSKHKKSTHSPHELCNILLLHSRNGIHARLIVLCTPNRAANDGDDTPAVGEEAEVVLERMCQRRKCR
jgi:hypothetical protein